MVIIVIGEILIDIFEDTWRIGGAPFNFAYHLKKMAQPIRFISRVGGDEYGRQILNQLHRHGFAAADIQVDRDHPTGTVQVKLDADGIPAFDIRTEAAYDYLDLDSLEDPEPDLLRLVYIGTLAQRTRHGFEQVQRFLSRKATHATCFCDLNLRPPHVNLQAVDQCLRRSHILKLNDGELDFLRESIAGPTGQDAYVNFLMTRFGIDTAALTLGDRGSTLYHHGQIVHSEPSGTAAVVDTVGAGDAYGAVLALGCLKGLAPRRMVALADAFARRICGIRGALPEDETMYQAFLHQQKG